MSRIIRILTLTLALAGLLQTALFAQGGMGKGKGMHKYDKSSETTITGTVQEVEFPDSPRGWQGVHLVLQVGDEAHAVHLGPRDYVEQEGFVFKTGDSIEVVASEVQCQGEDALMARQVTRSDNTLELRDKDGLPLWRGKLGRGPRS